MFIPEDLQWALGIHGRSISGGTLQMWKARKGFAGCDWKHLLILAGGCSEALGDHLTIQNNIGMNIDAMAGEGLVMESVKEIG